METFLPARGHDSPCIQCPKTTENGAYQHRRRREERNPIWVSRSPPVSSFLCTGLTPVYPKENCEHNFFIKLHEWPLVDKQLKRHHANLPSQVTQTAKTHS
jgi:hypothetical protein